MSNYHYCIVVGTLESEHDPGLAIQPGARHPGLPAVPHPPHKVPEGGVLSDVIVAGGHWHEDSLAKLLQHKIISQRSMYTEAAFSFKTASFFMLYRLAYLLEWLLIPFLVKSCVSARGLVS